MATIVGVTAVLVTEPPAKASVKPPKLFTTFAPLGDIEVNMTMEPARTGPNVIHLYMFTQAGVPAHFDDEAHRPPAEPEPGPAPVPTPEDRARATTRSQARASRSRATGR